MNTGKFRRIGVLAGVGVTLTVLIAGPALATVNQLSEYSFEDLSSSGVATDSISGNNGAAFGDPQPASSSDVPYSDPANLASAEFNGTNYFQINNTVGENFSICAWAKTASTGGETHWTSAPIADSESGGWALDFGFGINADGKLIFGNGGYATDSWQYDSHVVSTNVVNDSVWHHLCVTRDNSNGEVNLYVDGELDATGTTGTGILTSNQYIKIGNGSDGNSPFVGLIDDLRLFNSILTQAEIKDLAIPNAKEEQTNEKTPTGLADTGVTFDQSTMLLSALLLIAMGLLAIVLAKLTRN